MKQKLQEISVNEKTIWIIGIFPTMVLRYAVPWEMRCLMPEPGQIKTPLGEDGFRRCKVRLIGETTFFVDERLAQLTDGEVLARAGKPNSER